jgi:hypothetical protein
MFVRSEGHAYDNKNPGQTRTRPNERDESCPGYACYAVTIPSLWWGAKGAFRHKNIMHDATSVQTAR